MKEIQAHIQQAIDDLQLLKQAYYYRQELDITNKYYQWQNKLEDLLQEMKWEK